MSTKHSRPAESYAGALALSVPKTFHHQAAIRDILEYTIRARQICSPFDFQHKELPADMRELPTVDGASGVAHRFIHSTLYYGKVPRFPHELANCDWKRWPSVTRYISQYPAPK